MQEKYNRIKAIVAQYLDGAITAEEALNAVVLTVAEDLDSK